jgi:DNA helicase-2/ATP-dependent DNA helicase PcrA
MSLSVEQQQFIDGSGAGHSRLLAGPGTGKSFTCVALLEHLAGSDPKPRCHMITFTRAATKELKAKFAEHEGELTERPPSTAHSFAMSLLMKANPDGNLRMADDWEKRWIIEEIIKSRMVAAGHVIDVRGVRRLTEEMAAGWESLDGEKLELSDRNPVLAQAFIGAWQEAQRRLSFLHVSEIPYLAMLLVEDQPGIATGLDVLVVDEYQDLNRAEVRLIRLLSEQLSVISIGDDDQSIYSWRQAAPDALLAFCVEYQAPGFQLTKCFRCGPEILNPANAVIAAAAGRPAKPALESCSDEPGVFAQLNFKSSVEEFNAIAAIVKARLGAGVPPNEIAVLVRSSANKFRRELGQRLEASGIPITDQEWVNDALVEDEVRRLLALARLAIDPTDSLAWISLLRNTGGVGWSTLYKLYEIACQESCTFYEALQKEGKEGYPSLSPAAMAKVLKAVVGAEALVEKLQGEQLGAALGDGGWGEWLIERGDPDQITDDARAVFVGVGRMLMDEGESSLATFVNQLQPLARDLADQEENAVRVMTMAQSKGLTVNTAVLAAVDDSTLPLPGGDYEEERRILYVAMTRATDFSVITYAQRRYGPTAMIGLKGGARQRSPFLRGVPGIPSPEAGVAFVNGL